MPGQRAVGQRRPAARVDTRFDLSRITPRRRCHCACVSASTQRRPARCRDRMRAEPDVQRVGGHHVRARHAEPRGEPAESPFRIHEAPASGNRPIVTSGIATRERSVTSRYCDAENNPRPPPITTPWPKQITGLRRPVDRVVEPIFAFEKPRRIVVDLLAGRVVARHAVIERLNVAACAKRPFAGAAQQQSQRRRSDRSNAPAEAQGCRSSATTANSAFFRSSASQSARTWPDRVGAFFQHDDISGRPFSSRGAVMHSSKRVCAFRETPGRPRSDPAYRTA